MRNDTQQARERERAWNKWTINHAKCDEKVYHDDDDEDDRWGGWKWVKKEESSQENENDINGMPGKSKKMLFNYDDSFEAS